ncbi:hypothetical protein [Thermaerobacillus caldiproteolyticus]|uniref:hypothetical protein n=1 Tax=Thermaerobacillus caldiproteolyticus TaxID=247480 RepID=UPI00188D6247|nr:hypothetical protein [Anoxybacillus caldiproteolyticus]QPA33387.1 hypothetical protein ISX45_19240 [Anoxybacillus caldiproteolyticus]
MKTKIETIDFREFMAGTHRKSKRPTRAYSGFLPTITPQTLFPIHDGGFALFLAGVGTIMVVAFSERFLARGGFPEVAYAVAEIGRFVFPILAYGAVLWLFFFGLRGV